MDNKILIGCAILFVLIILYFSRANFELYDDMMNGMWVSDPEWAAKADLDGMLLFVGPSEGWYGDTRKCYIVLHADDRVIASKQIEMQISSRTVLVPRKNVSYYVEINDLDKDDDAIEGIKDQDDNIPFEDIMPKNLTLELGISSGKLVLKGINESGEEIEYARLYKDAVATEISRNRRDAEIVD